MMNCSLKEESFHSIRMQLGGRELVCHILNGKTIGVGQKDSFRRDCGLGNSDQHLQDILSTQALSRSLAN